MAKKNELTLSSVIEEVRRSSFSCRSINPAYSESVKQEALRHLENYRDSLDAAETADKGISEVGAIIRRQREHIAFLENELKSEKAALKKAHMRLDELEGEVKRMGAL